MILADSQASNANIGGGASMPQSANIERVTVTVSGRLHLGFVDLNGGLGRRFGSLGIALDAPVTRVTAVPGRGITVYGTEAERARAHLERLLRHYGIASNLSLSVEAAIPDHVGLGSGTQLGLAVGAAVSRFAGLSPDAREIAQLLDRGARSSIGIATFEQGGVVLDGGRGAVDLPPPVISRLPFPEAWRILLIFDDVRRGLHGPAESEAFHNLPALPAESAAHLCRLMLMVALPALAEQDLDGFGTAVTELQETIGDHFAPVQGARFLSAQVTEALAWLRSQGVRGLGQSSWGPTGFALVGSEAAAHTLLQHLQAHWVPGRGLSFAMARGRNRGADIEIVRRGP
jgi:beta-ribofuranosylaminobenzene 5'-phosphate synthase